MRVGYLQLSCPVASGWVAMSRGGKGRSGPGGMVWSDRAAGLQPGDGCGGGYKAATRAWRGLQVAGTA